MGRFERARGRVREGFVVVVVVVGEAGSAVV